MSVKIVHGEGGGRDVLRQKSPRGSTQDLSSRSGRNSDAGWIDDLDRSDFHVVLLRPSLCSLLGRMEVA